MKITALFVALAACSFGAIANPPAIQPAPAGHPAAATVPATAVTKKGKVISFVDTKSFTYIEVQDATGKLWVVAPTVAVKNGNTIAYADAPVQAKYRSPSLKRDFTNVVLTTRAVVEK